MTKPLLQFMTNKNVSFINTFVQFVFHRHYFNYLPFLAAFKDVTIVRRNRYEVDSYRSGNGQQCYKPHIFETQKLLN